MHGKNGIPKVVILGGSEKGMDLWNPATKSVEKIWDEIPPEENSSRGLGDISFVVVNGGSDLIYYGGFDGKNIYGIWKYSLNQNTWTKYKIKLSIVFQYP